VSAEVTSELRCYMRHIRAAKICAGGARDWWPKKGLDWRDFLANGIPAEVLTATGDAFALKVVREAERERDGQG